MFPRPLSAGTAEITTVENPERAALVALYEATNGPNWVNNANWLTDAPLGEWYGVHTDQLGRVVGLGLEGRTGEGAELFDLAFAMPEVADGDGRTNFAFVLPVRPGWETALASIALSGPGGSAILDESTDRPMALLRDPRSGQVRGFLRDTVSTTQAAADAATPGAAQGIEVLFSRGVPSADAWRR